MKIPITCENCDVRDLNPVWCGYYDRFCEKYDDTEISTDRAKEQDERN